MAPFAGLLGGGGGLMFVPYGLAVAAFLVFTVQSSLWLMGVVKSLERARDSEAALAVARERLRFSQDVHDVMGRRLSTIAVQAELAATLAARGDSRATDQVLEIRATAHEALREAGSWPAATARSTCRPRSAARCPCSRPRASAPGRRRRRTPGPPRARRPRHPRSRHQRAPPLPSPQGRHDVRRRRARRVERRCRPGPPGAGDGSGLTTLADQLAEHGARVTSGVEDERFVVRVDFAPAVSEVES